MQFRPLLALAALTTQNFQSYAAGTRFNWDEVPGASYYDGQIQQGQRNWHFRTPGQTIVLGEGAPTLVTAYDPSGRPLGNPEISSRPIPVQSLVNPTPRPAKKKVKARKKKRSRRAKQEKTLPPPVLPERHGGHVSLLGALGKESVASSGGVSDYSGDSNIAALIVRTAFDLRDPGWRLATDLDGHYFTTTTSESVNGSDATQETSKFLRLTASLGGFYDFYPDESPKHARLGAGFAYVRTPVLALHSDTTGEAKLENKAAAGPFIGFNYEAQLLSGDAGIDVKLLPFSVISDAQGLAFSAFGYYRMPVSTHWGVLFGLAIDQVQLSTPVACSGADDCRETAHSTTKVTEVRLGVDYSR